MSTPELERAPDTERPEPPPKNTLRPLMLRLHFYAGILIAPFILIATITGGLYAVAPSLEQVVYRHYLHVDSTGPAKPVADQIRAAQQERPDLAVTAVRPAAEQGATTRVLFTDPSLGESERLAVFVDPATATSVGELTVYGSGSALPMRTWLDQFHRHLMLGETGRLYSELAASWLWVVALGGLYLWVDRYRKMKQRNADSARLLTVDRSVSKRNRTLNWHGAVGVWLALGLVFLSATGLTWSKYAGENVTELRSALNWKTPAVATTLGDAPAPAAAGHEGHGAGHDGTAMDTDVTRANVRSVDDVLRIAAANGIDGQVEASIPADAGTATVVTQTRQPWVFATSSIAIDSATDRVVDIQRFADWPLAAKLTTWGIALHMGILFGWVSQLALVVLAVALTTVIVRGYLMWWRRRPTRGSAWAVGRPPLRGAIHRVTPAMAIGTRVVSAGVGYFVPLLGLSLLAFLVIDAVGGYAARARVSAAGG